MRHRTGSPAPVPAWWLRAGGTLFIAELVALPAVLIGVELLGLTSVWLVIYLGGMMATLGGLAVAIGMGRRRNRGVARESKGAAGAGGADHALAHPLDPPVRSTVRILALQVLTLPFMVVAVAFMDLDRVWLGVYVAGMVITPIGLGAALVIRRGSGHR